MKNPKKHFYLFLISHNDNVITQIQLIKMYNFFVVAFSRNATDYQVHAFYLSLNNSPYCMRHEYQTERHAGHLLFQSSALETKRQILFTVFLFNNIPFTVLFVFLSTNIFLVKSVINFSFPNAFYCNLSVFLRFLSYYFSLRVIV